MTKAISDARPGSRGLLMDGTRISTNPPEDVDFARRVIELTPSSATPEALEEQLRSDYPRVRVVRGVTDILERWYVYRDGRWARS